MFGKRDRHTDTTRTPGRKADVESTKWVIRKRYKISDDGTEPNEKISSNYWYPMLFFSAELLGKTLGNHLKLKRLTLRLYLQKQVTCTQVHLGELAVEANTGKVEIRITVDEL